jgi:hypothetical protein
VQSNKAEGGETDVMACTGRGALDCFGSLNRNIAAETQTRT